MVSVEVDSPRDHHVWPHTRRGITADIPPGINWRQQPALADLYEEATAGAIERETQYMKKAFGYFMGAASVVCATVGVDVGVAATTELNQLVSGEAFTSGYQIAGHFAIVATGISIAGMRVREAVNYLRQADIEDIH